MGSWQERSDWVVFGWWIGRSEATGLYLGGRLAGAKRLACIWVVDWQEQSNWLVFGWWIGRSEATGLYLGGGLAKAKQLACILLRRRKLTCLVLTCLDLTFSVCRSNGLVMVLLCQNSYIGIRWTS